jgi:ribonuclease P protein component
MISCSFTKSCRLLSAGDFLRLKTGSRSYRTKTFICYYKEIENPPGTSRLGLAVSRKVGKAHDRNRFKRLTKEFFRKSPIKDLGYDILVVYSPFLQKNFSERESAEQEILYNLQGLEKHLLNHK